jgi:hypothetical protein
MRTYTNSTYTVRSQPRVHGGRVPAVSLSGSSSRSSTLSSASWTRQSLTSAAAASGGRARRRRASPWTLAETATGDELTGATGSSSAMRDGCVWARRKRQGGRSRSRRCC